MSVTRTYTAPHALCCFHVAAVGEVTRLLFAAAGVPYTDTRFGFSKTAEGAAVFSPEWLSVRDDLSSYSFGKLPVLVVDGVQSISQSHVINRYLAKQFHLSGSNDVDSAHIESVVDQVIDLKAAMYRESDKTLWLQNNLPHALTQLQSFATAHGSNNSIVGSSLSLADIHLSNWFFDLSVDHGALVASLLAAAPVIAAVVAATEANKGIAAWMAVRPNTIY